MNFLSKRKYEFLFSLGAVGIIFYSTYLGFEHSIYNQDYHHSSFILSMVLDYKNGLKLFKDIFLQYGPGQIIIFDLINNFTELNIVNISKFTSLIYSANLFLLFIIFKNLSSSQISFLLILTLFLIHPYVILPWPDYLSGLSLSLFFFFFLRKNTSINTFICSFFLFLAIFFRSTYILNILFSIFIYCLIFFFFNKDNILKNIFRILIFLVSIFFIILFYFNTFSDWINQSILFISAYAEETKHLELYDKITSYVGKYGFIILKIFYYIFNSTIKLFNISNIENIIFVFFIIINFVYLFKVIRNKLILNSIEEKKIIFLLILGLSGFVQALMLMEIFRIFNATMAMFISGIFFLRNSNYINFINKYKKLLLLLIFSYISILFLNLPIKNYDETNFFKLENSYFKDKKLTKKNRDYYKNLNNFICNQENIILINISWDYALPHICDEKIIKSKSSMAKRFLRRMKKNEYDRIIIKSNLIKNEILFIDEKINNPKLKLITIFESQVEPRQWYNDIYVYKKIN